MATVLFNRPEEFLREMDAELGNCNSGPVPVCPGVMRLTGMTVASKVIPSVRTMSIVATFKSLTDPGDVVKLDYYCGDLCKMDDIDKRTWAAAEEVEKSLRAAAERYGMEVRSGLWQETPLAVI